MHPRHSGKLQPADDFCPTDGTKQVLDKDAGPLLDPRHRRPRAAVSSKNNDKDVLGYTVHHGTGAGGAMDNATMVRMGNENPCGRGLPNGARTG